MGKSYLVMLAHEYVENKHGLCGMFMSEKMDGMRCIWDGGVTRGMLASDVPWANTERDGRYVTPPRSTGLWSRYGNVIHAPDYWLDELPPYPLDGELWIGRKTFNELTSTVKCLIPPLGWDKVKYHIFDVPPVQILFKDRFIDIPNIYVKRLSGVVDWYMSRTKETMPAFYSFEHAYDFMRRKIVPTPHVCVHNQELLPFNTQQAKERLEEYLASVTAGGGEGVILRRAASIYTPERVYDSLKVKKMHDMEGTVIGYKWGKKTDRGSKLLGMMGSLTLKLDSGIVFDLSGFTEKEREMTIKLSSNYQEGYDAARRIGELHPGEVVTQENIHNPTFPIGCRVTFMYRELNPSGAPKEARYWRKKDGNY